MKQCPQCNSPYGYELATHLYACPECSHEWNTSEAKEYPQTIDELVVKDSNGTLLHDGDAVLVIKNLPVKGAPKPIKAGTKVSNIRLREGDHNIDGKIDGFGTVALKSEFVKKA
jgi:protein PhnA